MSYEMTDVSAVFPRMQTAWSSRQIIRFFSPKLLIFPVIFFVSRSFVLTRAFLTEKFKFNVLFTTEVMKEFNKCLL